MSRESQVALLPPQGGVPTEGRGGLSRRGRGNALTPSASRSLGTSP